MHPDEKWPGKYNIHIHILKTQQVDETANKPLNGFQKWLIATIII